MLFLEKLTTIDDITEECVEALRNVKTHLVVEKGVEELVVGS